MDYLQINIKTENVEETTFKLGDLGFYEFEIVEDFETVKKELDHEYWGGLDEENFSNETLIKLYIADDENSHDKIQLIKKEFDATLIPLVNEDWVNKWKEQFKAIEIGENIEICPIWQNATGTKTVIKVDPGMIFGTGAHETTQMCMEEMENRINSGDIGCDLGSGTGILAVLAMKLGASDLLCVDIDEKARGVIEQMAINNGVREPKILIGDLLKDKKIEEKMRENEYDFILANIIPSVIIPLIPLVKQTLKKQGVFITSGILIEKADMVKKALINNGFQITKEKTKGEWTALVAVQS